MWSALKVKSAPLRRSVRSVRGQARVAVRGPGPRLRPLLARDHVGYAETGAPLQRWLMPELTPLGAYTLLGVPMGELMDRVVDVGDVTEDFLLHRACAGPVPSDGVAEAW